MAAFVRSWPFTAESMAAEDEVLLLLRETSHDLGGVPSWEWYRCPSWSPRPAVNDPRPLWSLTPGHRLGIYRWIFRHAVGYKHRMVEILYREAYSANGDMAGLALEQEAWRTECTPAVTLMRDWDVVRYLEHRISVDTETYYQSGVPPEQLEF